HNAAVPAAVTLQVVGKLAHVDGFLSLAELPHANQVGLHVRLDLTLGTHGLEGAVAVLGEGAHGEADRAAVLHEQVGLLVIYHIVVAMVHTPAIGAFPQSLIGAFQSVLHAEHRGDPTVPLGPAGFGAGDIDLLRVKGAGVLGLAAVQAAQ